MKRSLKKQAIRRLSIITGQVRGLQKMVEGEKYCIDIIHQTLAVKKALSSLEDEILKNHLTTCALDQMKSGKESRAVKEILSVYKISKAR